jgi:hypothetical protein
MIVMGAAAGFQVAAVPAQGSRMAPRQQNSLAVIIFYCVLKSLSAPLCCVHRGS